MSSYIALINPVIPNLYSFVAEPQVCLPKYSPAALSDNIPVRPKVTLAIPPLRLSII